MRIREATAGWNRPMLWLAGSMAVMSVLSAIGLAVDDRVLTGAPIWAKPLKFSLSFVLYGVTWAWMASLITVGARTVRWSSAVVVVMLVVEEIVIVGQVVRGRTSHFNFSTPVDEALFTAMGISIVAAWTGTLILSILLLRSRGGDAATMWSVRLGAALSLVGLALGALMLGPTDDQLRDLRAGTGERIVGAHSVGVPDGGPGLPVLGWSTTGGDLRIPHFVGMHALQVLPLAALALLALGARLPLLRPATTRLRLVVVGAAGYAGLVALVTWQALRGQALVRPDALTLAAAGLLAAAVTAGVAASLRRGRADLRRHAQEGLDRCALTGADDAGLVARGIGQSTYSAP